MLCDCWHVVSRFFTALVAKKTTWRRTFWFLRCENVSFRKFWHVWMENDKNAFFSKTTNWLRLGEGFSLCFPLYSVNQGVLRSVNQGEWVFFFGHLMCFPHPVSIVSIKRFHLEPPGADPSNFEVPSTQTRIGPIIWNNNFWWWCGDGFCRLFLHQNTGNIYLGTARGGWCAKYPTFAPSQATFGTGFECFNT